MKTRLLSVLVALAAIAFACNPDPAPNPNPKPDPKPPVDTIQAGPKDTIPNPPAPPVLPEVVKILAIGNSFSADAVEQELWGLFNAAGQKVIIGDMYIGGCPLADHAANVTSDAAAYSYRKIGVDGALVKTSSVKLSTAFADEDWTFISVQEGAGYHGFYNTTYNGVTHSMEPALTTLITAIQKACPKAKLVYHAPWTAAKNYTGTKFSYYGFNEPKMYEMICTATKEVLAAHPEFELFMNSFDAVDNARSSYFGDTMNRDGWHMNYTTGRYTVGCLWFEKIMGVSVVGNSYYPSTISEKDAFVCQTAAHEAVLHPYKITDLSYIEKPAEDPNKPVEKRDTLAYWYFTPARAKSDGCVKTWTGQEELGVYRYSLEAGERGYYPSNGGGKGKISYIQTDKTAFKDTYPEGAGLVVFNVSNGGQPMMCGPMAGDCWQFETTGGFVIPEGTKVHVRYTYAPVSYGAKYWYLEYKDGSEFKPVPGFEVKTESIASGETITYNLNLNASEFRIIDCELVYETETTEVVVRQSCASQYQVNSKMFNYPNAKCVSRIAGDPANENKPLPLIYKVL